MTEEALGGAGKAIKRGSGGRLKTAAPDKDQLCQTRHNEKKNP